MTFPHAGLYHPDAIFDLQDFIDRMLKTISQQQNIFCQRTLVLTIMAQNKKIYLVEKHSFKIQNKLFIKVQV